MKGLNPKNTIHIPDDASLAAHILQPAIFEEGDIYSCLLGDNPLTGIIGCGDTPAEALEDWEDTLKERINAGDPDDEVAVYAVQELLRHKEEISAKNEQDFMRQFRPGK
jgi:hypothetical protein